MFRKIAVVGVGTVVLVGVIAAATVTVQGIASQAPGQAPPGQAALASTSAPGPAATTAKPEMAPISAAAQPVAPTVTPVLARSGSTHGIQQDVRDNMPVYFNTFWPGGGDVVMTLVSPSGRVIDRGTDAPDVLHILGPTSEHYEVTNPEAGTWTVQLYGADVAATGTDTQFSFFQEPEPNQPPVARMTLSRQGNQVTVDASASYDPDGSITEVFWDYGDGEVDLGVTATHTFERPGDYLVAMGVTDNADRMDFTQADVIVHVRGM